MIVERGEGVWRGPRYPFGHAAWRLNAAALPLATAATFGPRNGEGVNRRGSTETEVVIFLFHGGSWEKGDDE